MSFFFMLFPLTLQIAPELISIAGDTRTYTALRQWDRTRRPVCGPVRAPTHEQWTSSKNISTPASSCFSAHQSKFLSARYQPHTRALGRAGGRAGAFRDLRSL